MKKEVLEAAEDTLGALNDAFECFDDNEYVEGAVSDLKTIQESLRTLLPEFGIYAWVCYDTDPGDIEPLRARSFSSVEEAEEALNENINAALENLDDVGCEASYNDVEICGHDLVLHLDDYHIICWRRMYDPEAKGSEKDCETVHLKTVVAEPYGNNAVNGSFAITCAVPDEKFDLAAAIRKASQEYVGTPKGMSVYHSNCDHFGWGDFEAYVPDELCRKYGFSRVSVSQEDDVDWDECIAEPESITFENILSGLPTDRDGAKDGTIGGVSGYWTDGSVILCETEEDADALQDWLSECCRECLEEECSPAKALGEPYERGGKLCPWTVYVVDYDIPEFKEEDLAGCCGSCGFLTQDPTYDSLPTYCGCEESENSLDWKDSPEDLADCCGCWEKRVGKIRTAAGVGKSASGRSGANRPNEPRSGGGRMGERRKEE